MAFTFVDLFAGIGGFHAALSSMGGECVFASENNRKAAMVYERNWGLDPYGDLTVQATEDVMDVPDCDVLTAGFPCQPFSKSGAQRGMDETRGTLYWNILQVIRARKPRLVLLENVRNLAGPRHRHEWQIIIETLRAEGYVVSDEPSIFSPHLLPPEVGGRPQVRERVFICATFLGENAENHRPLPVAINQPVAGWDPMRWNLEADLPVSKNENAPETALSESEIYWIDAWDEFVRLLTAERERQLPGFPLWADSWVDISNLQIPDSTPRWKADFLRKNSEFYSSHASTIDDWKARWDVESDRFPPSRRKLEWQAQDCKRLWDTLLHFRPSGIRAKKPTYTPALVAITQTSVLAPARRRISVREAARLQGLPEWFDFGDQSPADSFRQLGNGVSIGAVWHVLKSHVERDQDFLQATAPEVLRSINGDPNDWSRHLSEGPPA